MAYCISNGRVFEVKIKDPWDLVDTTFTFRRRPLTAGERFWLYRYWSKPHQNKYHRHRKRPNGRGRGR